MISDTTPSYAADSIVELVQVLRSVSKDVSGAAVELREPTGMGDDRERYYLRSHLSGLVEAIEGVDHALMSVLRSVDRLRQGGSEWDGSIGCILARNLSGITHDKMVE